MRISRCYALMSGAAVAASAARGDTPSPSAETAFTYIGKAWLDAYSRTRPVGATDLGDHRFDAELDDVDETGRAECRRRPHHRRHDLGASRRDSVTKPMQRSRTRSNSSASTIPDSPVKVIEMPKIQQGLSVANCDSPGPLDRHFNTFYAISPISADWWPEQTTTFLREYNSRLLLKLIVHEAKLGHYVLLWRSNNQPSTARRAGCRVVH